ncbi:hypothetical protein [Gorillibacterium sp. CAU 1737]|uniref:hypothetical protein n=1 Tax=Gorillibacterium sp. CAU 1737 TaxID=3140362 RepID=UPI00325FF291
MTKRLRRISLFILLPGFGVAIYFFIQMYPYQFLDLQSRSLRVFQDYMNFSLPGKPTIPFHKDTHGGFHGDGTMLTVYQLKEEEIKQILLEQKIEQTWNKLPMRPERAKALHELFEDSYDEDIPKQRNFGAQEGYYLLITRKGEVIAGDDFQQPAYYNIIVCLIDTKSNRVSLYTSDT